jgi:nucleoside-diphosphate-sugar epimerase
VRRLVLLSSIGVLGASSEAAPFDAHSPPAPHDFYSRTKLDAERVAATTCQKSSVGLCVVRPPMVFGPGAPGNFARLIALVRRGMPLPLGLIDNRRSLVSVWNLCDLLSAALTHNAATTAPLLVADDPAVSTPELIRMCAAAMSVPVRLLPVPPALLRLAAATIGRGADVKRLCDSLVVDARETYARLEWQPRLELAAGLERTLGQPAGPRSA